MVENLDPSVGRILDKLEQMSLTVGLSRVCDGVVLVVESERLSAEVISRAKDQLTLSDAKIFGVTLNKQKNSLTI